MKTMTKVLVLATITLMSASTFAADSAVGAHPSSNCAESANGVVKAQAQAPVAAPADPAKTDTSGKKAD